MLEFLHPFFVIDNFYSKWSTSYNRFACEQWNLTQVFYLSGVAVLSSMLAYLFAQFIDIRIYHFGKRKPKRLLWLRNNFSTFTSQFIDSFTVIFLLCSFDALPWDSFLGLLVSAFIFKVLVALIDTPLLYLRVYLFRKKFELRINESYDLINL